MFNIQLNLKGTEERGEKYSVENGGVYVDSTANDQGIVFPQFIDNSTARNAGDLVQVVIR